MTRSDMPELAADHERKLVVGKEFDPVTREHQRVGLAEAQRDDRHVVVLADEDQRHWYFERRAGAFDDGKNARVLTLVNSHAGAEQAPSRERHVYHCEHDEKGHLRGADRLVQDVTDEQRGRKRQECRHPERDPFGRLAQRTGPGKERLHVC